MIIGEQCSFISALASWGRHEVVTRGRYAPEALDDASLLEYALITRAHGSRRCSPRSRREFTARFEPSDVATFTLFRAGTVSQRKAGVLDKPDSESYRGFRTLADGSEPVRGR